jgi:hypothetical protein
MGLSIHYSGYLLKKVRLDSLIEEVLDVARTLGWTTHIFNDEDIKEFLLFPKEVSLLFIVKGGELS